MWAVTNHIYCAVDGIEERHLPEGMTWEYVMTNGRDGLAVQGYTGADSTLFIPDYYMGLPIISLAEHAFENNQEIMDVYLPEFLIEMGNYAFSGCSNLSRLYSKGYGENSYTLYHYGVPYRVHEGFPQGLEVLGNYAFNDCTYLVMEGLVIPDMVGRIGDYTFNGCSGIMGELTLPYGVNYIGEQAFYGCTNLGYDYGTDSSTELQLPDSVVYVGARAFNNCRFEGLTLSQQLNEVGEEAFYGFSGDLVIPDTLMYAGRRAFDGYWSSLTFPTYFAENCNGVWPDWFVCSDITNFTMPDGFTTISENSFFRVTLSGTTTLPSSLRTIGATAFNSAIVNGDLVIPEGVHTIGPCAFSYAEIHGSLTIPSSAVYFPAATTTHSGYKYFLKENGEMIQNVSSLALVDAVIDGNLIFADGTRTIANGFAAFAEIKGQLVLPESLNNIQMLAFYEFSAQYSELLLPEGITTIGDYAFTKSKFKGTLRIPGGLEEMGIYLFHECSGFNALILEEGLESISCGMFYQAACLRGELVIPDTVQIIEPYAFAGCVQLTGDFVILNIVKCSTNAFENSGVQVRFSTQMTYHETIVDSIELRDMGEAVVPFIYFTQPDTIQRIRLYRTFGNSIVYKLHDANITMPYFADGVPKGKIAHYVMVLEGKDGTIYFTEPFSMNDQQFNKPVYRALIIGNEDFSAWSTADDIFTAPNNVEYMDLMLRSVDEKFTIWHYMNVNNTTLLEKLDYVFGLADDNDVTVLYLNTHGSPDGTFGMSRVQDGETTTDTSDPAWRVSTAQIKQKLSNKKGKKILFLEICYASTMFDQIGEWDSDYIIFAAASESSQSYSYQGRPFSFFTAGILDSVGFSGSMPADSNHDGKMTVAELHKGIWDKLGSFFTWIQQPATLTSNPNYVLFTTIERQQE